MGDPEFLGVWLEADVNESEGEDEGDGEGGDEYEEAVVVVEACDFLEDELEVHVVFVSNWIYNWVTE